MLNFAIIGAGLIGKKRADAIVRSGHSVVAVCDINSTSAHSLAKSLGATPFDQLGGMLQTVPFDAAIVATSNDALSESVVAVLEAKRHVLVEKPGGRNPEEVRRWTQLANSSERICRVGFNHRFHPALQKAQALLSEGALGELLFFRAKYGHGGRIGYDTEWRADPARSGGGELLDQGVHLIDLCRWLGGEFELEFGRADTYFWNMKVDDNGFLCLKSPNKKVRAWLHASCTEWKNTFEFEIFGNKGKIQITGLGRSYGAEELRHYRVKPEMGVPLLDHFTFPEEDGSWQLETLAFLQEIQGSRGTGIALPQDALRAVEIVYDAYRTSGMA